MSHRSALTALLALALATRALVGGLTAIPGRDAAHYLWMAGQAASGHPADLFRTVFHPGYPLLVAAPLALDTGLDPFRWGQAVALGAGALALLPLHALTRRVYDTPTAHLAALLYAVGTWFCRHPADALSEGPFYLCVAVFAERLVGPADRARVVVAGLAAAGAYACRPEGAALPVLGALWLHGSRRTGDGGWLLAVAAIAAAPLPLGWALLGDGFTLTPKAAFNYDVGVGQAGSVVGHYLRELGRLPGAALEDLGYLALPLAAVGALRGARYTRTDPRLLLLAPFLVQCAVIPLLRAHYRFVSGFGILLLPLAAAAAVAIGRGLLARRALASRRALVSVGLGLLLAPDLVRLPHARRTDRIVLRELGHYVGASLLPGDAIATDMPRLAFYAGVRPPPPRVIGPAEILAQARQPATRFVVIVAGRTPLATDALTSIGFRPITLPDHLASLAAARGIRILLRD